MLRLNLQSPLMFNPDGEGEFYRDYERTLSFEHSLVSLSKWEGRWHKPYLDSKKTFEEVLDYVWCMCLDDVQPEVMRYLTPAQVDTITDYISESKTATTFREMENLSQPKKEIVTAEIIYWWMILYHIPFSCETWHLDRLFTLIRVASIKSSPEKKMTAAERRAWQIAENERRKNALNTKG